MSSYNYNSDDGKFYNPDGSEPRRYDLRELTGDANINEILKNAALATMRDLNNIGTMDGLGLGGRMDVANILSNTGNYTTEQLMRIRDSAQNRSRRTKRYDVMNDPQNRMLDTRDKLRLKLYKRRQAAADPECVEIADMLDENTRAIHNEILLEARARKCDVLKAATAAVMK